MRQVLNARRWAFYGIFGVCLVAAFVIGCSGGGAGGGGGITVPPPTSTPTTMPTSGTTIHIQDINHGR